MRWVLVLLLAGLVAWLLMPRRESRPAQVAVAAPAKAPAILPSARHAPPAAPVAVRPAAAVPVDRMAILQRVAQTTGVTLRGFRPAGDGGIISLAWSSSNKSLGGDFLEQAVRQGAIRNFDVDGRYGMVLENGREVQLAEYTVHF